MQCRVENTKAKNLYPMIQHYKFIQQEKRTWLEGNEVGA